MALIGGSQHKVVRGRLVVANNSLNNLLTTSGESRIILLPERSSICQYRPKLSAINVKSNQEHVYFWPTLYCTF